jgi:ABC-type multidrug transport system fused ATPase/permease subunit
MRCRRAGVGLVGLSLSYALAITGLLNSLLTSFAETEQEMVAVERILEYTDVQPQVRVPGDMSLAVRPAWGDSLSPGWLLH